MALTLEDLDRRVATLEKATEREKSIERAVSEIVAESEKRLQTQISTSIDASEKRTADRISAAQREITSQMNNFQQAILAAIDAKWNPPK